MLIAYHIGVYLHIPKNKKDIRRRAADVLITQKKNEKTENVRCSQTAVSVQERSDTTLREESESIRGRRNVMTVPEPGVLSMFR